MHTEEYIEFIEDFTSEEVDLDIKPATVKKLATTAKILEKEHDFTLDDILEELMNVSPINEKEFDSWQYFLTELSHLILDEIEANINEDDDLDDLDEEIYED